MTRPSQSARRPPVPAWAMLGVFLILWGSYAFFRQRRDWNSASRLMLVYALGDRGTVALNGLDRHTGDKAAYRGRFYTDKAPGYSLAAVPVYLLAKSAFGVPAHPLGEEAEAYVLWPADYAVTLGTAGLPTAATGALLVLLAARIGCPPRWSVAVGLAYGLGTPAYVYATLAYSYGLTSFCLLGSFSLIAHDDERGIPILRGVLAGILAGLAGLSDLSIAPVAILLSASVVILVARQGWPVGALVGFALGALGPLLVLLGYNTLAYGNPLDLGYAHHTIPRFRQVHGSGNPLGLQPPRWDRALPLIWGEFRGLLWYAPIVTLAPLGWCALARQGRRLTAGFASLACLAIFLVNLSYPEWTGGWCTGPRLLTPLLPFAMAGVAGALTMDGRFGRLLRTGSVALALAGCVVVLLCVGVGGRIPDELNRGPDQPPIRLLHPLRDVVWPLWRGEELPPWWIGERFATNLVSIAWPQFHDSRIVPPARQWMQFLPLLTAQATAVVVLLLAQPGRPPAGANGGHA